MTAPPATAARASPQQAAVGPAAVARRALALLVLGTAAFTVYGSLVPFAFRDREFGEAANSFLWAMTRRAVPQSRSDAVANVLLGVPLGFALLGLCRLGKASRIGDVLTGATLLPGCLLFAAGVEFAQLFALSRTCSGSDVICQALGAVVGMTGWVVAGRWLVRQGVEVWYGSDAAARVLVGYLALLAFIQLLPMDLSASPKDLYKKVRDRVVLVPFSELAGAEGDQLWDRAARLIQVFGLYLPVGLLVGGLPGWSWRAVNVRKLIAAAIGLATAMEALQLIVHSRVPSATDVFVGAAGALAGWLVRQVRADGLSAGDALGLGAWWLIGLAVVSWQPFPPLALNPPRPFDWTPGMPLEGGHPLFALEEMVTKFVLFGLGGAVVGAVAFGAKGPGRWVLAAGIGLVVSAVFEAGQSILGTHTPCITDVLLGGAGASVGAWVADRVRAGAV